MEQGGARRVEIAGMSALELGPAGAPLELVFLHATGFHAALYAPILAPLAKMRRILAPDLRGHGRTILPADAKALTSWDPFVDDVRRLLRALEGPVVLAGHSLGASVSALAAGKAQDKVRALAVLEPVLRPRADADGQVHHSARTLEIARATRARRRRFPSREAAIEAYRGRGGFKTWSDKALAAFVKDGFVDASKTAEGGDGVALRCDPAFEAAIYLARGGDVMRALGRLQLPLVVRSGEIGSTFPPSSERRFKRRRPDADVARVDGASHYLPLERPDLTREAIEHALAAAGFETGASRSSMRQGRRRGAR